MDKLLLLAKVVGELKNQIKALQNTPPEIHHFVGEQGIAGKDGLNGINGKDGLNGTNGKDGKDGLDGNSATTIVSVEVDFDNHLVITMSDDSVIDAGEIKVTAGKNTQIVQTRGGEDVVTYTTRYDQVSDLLAYKAEAAVGSLDSNPVWRIQKLVYGLDGDITITWCQGNSDFRFIWNDRTTLTYK